MGRWKTSIVQLELVLATARSADVEAVSENPYTPISAISTSAAARQLACSTYHTQNNNEAAAMGQHGRVEHFEA